MQAIEILPVMVRDGRLLSMRPDCAPSFVVGWPAGARPEDVAAKALETLRLSPIVLHSTSWRHADGEVVLTYLSAIAPVADPPPSSEVEPALPAYPPPPPPLPPPPHHPL